MNIESVPEKLRGIFVNPEYVLAGMAVLLACLFGVGQIWPSIVSRRAKILFMSAIFAISGITIVLMFMEKPGPILPGPDKEPVKPQEKQKSLSETKDTELKTEKNKSRRVDIHEISLKIPSGWKRIESKEYALALIPKDSTLESASEYINIGYFEEEEKLKGKKEGEMLYKYGGDIKKAIVQRKEVKEVEEYKIRTSNFKVSEEDPLYNKDVFGIGGSGILTYDDGVKKYEYKAFFLDKGVIYKINASSKGGKVEKIDFIDSSISKIVESISVKSD